jgi:hypothetical protein
MLLNSGTRTAHEWWEIPLPAMIWRFWITNPYRYAEVLCYEKFLLSAAAEYLKTGTRK